jgi:hypothetical protein|tara:strand:- start:325 stop:576 length:252 start_codon:yes stop_codon:yes gene_type:complete
MFSNPKKQNADQTNRVKALVRDIWDIDEGVVIMVSELKCYEDGCPDLETVVVLMDEGAQPKTIKINKCLSEIDVKTISSHCPA